MGYLVPIIGGTNMDIKFIDECIVDIIKHAVRFIDSVYDDDDDIRDGELGRIISNVKWIKEELTNK